MTDYPAPSGPRRAALIFIFVTVALDILALGLTIPVLPKLVENFLGGRTARAAEIIGLFLTAWALMQFFMSPILGALSDRFGRRPVILLSNLGLGLDYILMALAPNLAWLFVGRVVNGATAASISTAYAYIADVTTPEKRAAGFGLLGAAFSLGFVFGPALGGVLGDIDLRLPFWVAAGLSLANFLYGYFVLPESLKPGNRAKFRWGRANPLGSLKLLRSKAGLLGLAGVSFLYYLGHEVFAAIFVLHAGFRFGWDALTVGIFLAAVGVASALVQGGLIRPAIKHLGERRAALIGFAAGASGMAVYGLAPAPWMFWVGIAVMALWGLSAPAVHALMSKRLGASEQGQLQGANAAMRGIAGLIGPGLYTTVFAQFLGPLQHLALPGAPYLVAAALLFAAGLLLWRTTRSGRNQS